jgi:predicted nucleic acid-binding protein
MPLLPRSNHRHDLTAAEIDALVDILSMQAEGHRAVTARRTRFARDPDDRRCWERRWQRSRHRADCLVTGDKGLLATADRHPFVTLAKSRATHAGL